MLLGGGGLNLEMPTQPLPQRGLKQEENVHMGSLR